MSPAEDPLPFAGLTGWESDDLEEALAAYLSTADASAGPLPWQSTPSARAFFESAFQPVLISGQAFYTGYYEPELAGSLQRTERFRFPLHAPPPDLREDEVWHDRAAIEAGDLLAGREIVWLDDPLEAFLAQVQGSVRIRLMDGRIVRLGFEAKNNQPYRSIGQELILRGEGTDGRISVDQIRAWARRNPGALGALLRINPSYVFFRALDLPAETGPLTTMQKPAVPMRTLAVDPAHVPLGTPVWIEAEGFRRLMVAQDTGGAIKGAGRGDIYVGSGAEAGRVAGSMQLVGRMVALRPKAERG